MTAVGQNSSAIRDGTRRSFFFLEDLFPFGLRVLYIVHCQLCFQAQGRTETIDKITGNMCSDNGKLESLLVIYLLYH
jgi:hypothetical protein